MRLRERNGTLSVTGTVTRGTNYTLSEHMAEGEARSRMFRRMESLCAAGWVIVKSHALGCWLADHDRDDIRRRLILLSLEN